MINAGIYGGGVYGPSIRGRDTQPLVGGREGPRPVRVAPPVGGKPKPRDPLAPDKGDPFPRPRPDGKPKPKGKGGNPKYDKALKDLQAQLDKFWAVPKLQVPKLQLPTLAEPTLSTAQLEDFNVQPLAIGNLPTLEAAPEASPVTAIPDRQSAQMRAAKIKEIDRIKSMRGYQSTMLATGPRGDTSRAQTRRGI